MNTSDVDRNMTTAAETPKANQVAPEALPKDDNQDFGILDLLTMLGEGKWIVLGVTTISVVIGLVLSLTATPIFSSKAVIMPPTQQASAGPSGAGGALAQLSQLPGLGVLGVGGRSPDQIYVAFMRSQTFQDTIIKKHDLRAKWSSNSIEDARMRLSSKVSIATDKSGMINVEVQDADGNFAADLANSHVAELSRMLDRVAITEAQQRRMFYESQIARTKKNLATAEVFYRQAQASSGIQLTSMLAESNLRTASELRAKITSLEIQMQVSSPFVTNQNPDVRRMTSELSVLRGRLEHLEQGSGQIAATPRQQETMQAFRELKVQEALLEGFVRQLEIAKIDESKEGVPIQIVDIALPAEIRSSPQRTKMVKSYAALGFGLGVALALLFSASSRLSGNDANKKRLRMLRNAWVLPHPSHSNLP